MWQLCNTLMDTYVSDGIQRKRLFYYDNHIHVRTTHTCTLSVHCRKFFACLIFATKTSYESFLPVKISQSTVVCAYIWHRSRVSGHFHLCCAAALGRLLVAYVLVTKGCMHLCSCHFFVFCALCSFQSLVFSASLLWCHGCVCVWLCALWVAFAIPLTLYITDVFRLSCHFLVTFLPVERIELLGQPGIYSSSCT